MLSRKKLHQQDERQEKSQHVAEQMDKQCRCMRINRCNSCLRDTNVFPIISSNCQGYFFLLSGYLWFSHLHCYLSFLSLASTSWSQVNELEAIFSLLFALSFNQRNKVKRVGEFLCQRSSNKYNSVNSNDLTCPVDWLVSSNIDSSECLILLFSLIYWVSMSQGHLFAS